MEICTIENVTFSYPGAQLPTLTSLNLSINQGEFVVLFGESGSGKTTLLKLLKKELTPHGTRIGNIYYKGTEIEEIDERISASEIGFVMQDPETQIVTDKVWHEIAFGLENIGVDPAIIRSRVGEIANYFGIHTWFRKDTDELSGGQKQLLNLASVMAMQPKILILDEPTSQLDPIAATNFLHTLKKLNDDLGITIIMVEHRLEEVLPIADKVVFLEKGSLLFTNTPRSIGEQLKKLHPDHPMLLALPTGMKIAHAMQQYHVNPLTIKEGQVFLSTHYQQGIRQLDKKEVKQSSKVILEVKDAWFRYEKKSEDILADVNMSFLKGEIFSVLGGNGSGKSTFLNVLARQLRPYRGKILLHNKNINKYGEQSLYHQNIALLPQDPQTVFIKETIREDYEELLKAYDFSNEDIATMIADVASRLGIVHILNAHPYDVSGGEQQKAALGKVLLLQPKILLLDEPTKGIDAFAKQTLQRILRDLQAQGLTIIFVTHDIEFAAQIANRVGLYFDNDLISVNTPTAFFTNNNFYTTASNRMTRNIFEDVTTTEEVITLCRLNEELKYEKAVD